MSKEEFSLVCAVMGLFAGLIVPTNLPIISKIYIIPLFGFLGYIMGSILGGWLEKLELKAEADDRKKEQQEWDRRRQEEGKRIEKKRKELAQRRAEEERRRQAEEVRLKREKMKQKILDKIYEVTKK